MTMYNLKSAMFNYGLAPNTQHSQETNSVVYKLGRRRFPTVVSLTPEDDEMVTVVILCSPITKFQKTAVFRLTIEAACIMLLAMVTVKRVKISPPANSTNS